jgi:hypothetical protein
MPERDDYVPIYLEGDVIPNQKTKFWFRIGGDWVHTADILISPRGELGVINKPCLGQNSNVCVAEGCFDQSCLDDEKAAMDYLRDIGVVQEEVEKSGHIHKPINHNDSLEPWCDGCLLTGDYAAPKAITDVYLQQLRNKLLASVEFMEFIGKKEESDGAE